MTEVVGRWVLHKIEDFYSLVCNRGKNDILAMFTQTGKHRSRTPKTFRAYHKDNEKGTTYKDILVWVPKG